jgi:hypothetical protein
VIRQFHWIAGSSSSCRFSYSTSVCYDELAAEWPFIAADRTLIVDTKGRIVIGFAVTQGAQV